jgi:hypothetical protein
VSSGTRGRCADRGSERMAPLTLEQVGGVAGVDGVGGVLARGRRSDPSKVERSPTGGGAAGVVRWPAGRRPADGGPPPVSN